MTDNKSKTGYKSLSSELDEIIEELQSNNLDVDHVLLQYERGVKVISDLEKYLNEAENKVKKVTTKPSKPKA